MSLLSVTGPGVHPDLAVYPMIWTLCVCTATLAMFVLQRSRGDDRTSWVRKLQNLPTHVSGAIGAICTIPEVFSLPLIGNLSLLRGLPHLTVTKMMETYGKIFKLQAGGDRTFVILNDIEMVREAMKKYSTALSGKPQSTTTQMTNDGAQKDMGKRWNKRRNITMTAFKSLFRNCPDKIHDICDEELTSLVKTLRSRPEEGHDVTHDITYFVARSMWRMIYGRGQCPDENTCDQLHTLSTKMDDYTQNSGPFCVLDRFPTFKKLVAGSMSRYKDAVKFMNEFCDGCEKERRFHGNSDGAPDLMTFMARGAKTLSPDDAVKLDLTEDLLYKGIGDLVRAGTESPSLLVIWVCLVLAKHQDVQSKMADELRFYDDPSADVSTICEANTEHMPYTQAVVYETIRYCSVIPFLKRRCLSDVTIGDYKLPTGTNIIINNHAISHDKARWVDPDVFRPERFLCEDGRFDSSRLELFLPFGVGKRRCMGEEIGKVLPFSAIATLVLNFNISSKHPIDLAPSFGITLTPARQSLIFSSRNVNKFPNDVS